jgi:hypothetical protein
MAIVSGSITITSAAPAAGELAAGNWLIVKQTNVPPEQRKVTSRDVADMLAMIRVGKSARQALSRCPVSRTRDDNVWTARWTAEIEVHHAEGVEYELEVTKDGVLLPALGPLLSRKQRSASYDVDYNLTQQLGWRVGNFGTFRADWDGYVYDEHGNRIVLDKPDVTHVDGFAYVSSAVFGTFRARGTAEYDKWTVTVEHQLGTKWDSSLWAVAFWPLGIPRELQQKYTVEIKLPQCVIDAFDKCADSDFWTNRLSDEQVIFNICNGKKVIDNL